MDDWINKFRNNEIVFNIKEENNKIELYMFTDSKKGATSYEQVRDEIEKDMENSNISNLQDEIIGPRALEIEANVSTAFASRSPKAASSSKPEMISLYLTGKDLYLGKFVQIFF